MIIPRKIEPTLEGLPLERGDEIAVYTPRGTCAGAEVWKGGNLAFPIWADDPFTEDSTEGIATGETLSLRIWDASAKVEYGEKPEEVTVVYTSDPPYNSSGQYKTNGIYLLASLAAQSNSAVNSPGTDQVPSQYDLAPNYPNPFNPATTITYALPTSGQTTLVVYDMLARQVSVLVDRYQEAGRYEVQFDGAGLPSGNYVYRLQSGAFSSHGIMVLSK